MKKILLLIAVSTFAFNLCAQNVDDNIDYYKGVENNKELNLTTDQIAKIKKLNREVGPKFAAIGQDSSLSGREKGQKKKELALQHKAAVKNILTPAQVSIWEKNHGKIHDDQGIKNAFTDNIDAKLDKLGEKYKSDEIIIENNPLLNKKEKKEQKKALKEQYKQEKQKLKDQKNAVKDSPLLQK